MWGSGEERGGRKRVEKKMHVVLKGGGAGIEPGT